MLENITLPTLEVEVKVDVLNIATIGAIIAGLFILVIVVKSAI